MYSGNNVVAGAGTLYAAPLGTAEPTACTGAWPTGWSPLGFTSQGSVFNLKPTVNPIYAEEEYFALRQVITLYEGDVTFAMEELTFNNWMLAINSGFGTSQTSENVTTVADGSKRITIPTIGTEPRVMIGWDSLTEGTPSGEVTGRLIIPQALQSGSPQLTRRKGANIATLNVQFMIEKGAGKDPFAMLIPPSLQVS